jgi:diadenosine tetraphosphatase ApaH/serine/threonine PP2A family protein phosphatase
MGNHDYGVLRRVDAGIDESELERSEHARLAKSLPPEHIEYLRSMKPYFRLPEYPEVVVVHAGVVPGIAIDVRASLSRLLLGDSVGKWLRNSQDIPLRDLFNVRTLNPNGSANHSDAGTPWIDVYTGPDLIVYGHDAVKGVQRRTRSIGLDSGCCYGGALTALIWPEDRLVSVPAAAVYSTPTKTIPPCPTK